MNSPQTYKRYFFLDHVYLRPKLKFATSSHFHVICWSHVLSFLCGCHCSKLRPTQHYQLCYMTDITSSTWVDSRVGCEWPQIRVVLNTPPWAFEMKWLGFPMVMVNNVETMTKRNPHHFVKALVKGHINKEDLDWTYYLAWKPKPQIKKDNDSLR